MLVCSPADGQFNSSSRRTEGRRTERGMSSPFPPPSTFTFFLPPPLTLPLRALRGDGRAAEELSSVRNSDDSAKRVPQPAFAPPHPVGEIGVIGPGRANPTRLAPAGNGTNFLFADFHIISRIFCFRLTGLQTSN